MLASLSASNDSTDDSAGITAVPGMPPPSRSRVGRARRDRAAQQQAGVLVSTRWASVEVDHAGPRQLLAPRRAAQLLGAAPQPLESFLGDHLGDPGAIQRDPFPREHQRDLVDRVTRRAQLNDPVVRALLPGARLGPGREERKNSRRPARKSRTSEFSVSTV